MTLRGCFAVLGALGIVASCSTAEREFGSEQVGGAGSGDHEGAISPYHDGGRDSAEGEGGSPGGAGPSAAGEAPGEPVVELGEPCLVNGALGCNGASQKLTLLCKKGLWTEGAICNSDENCDRATGACAPILPDCEDRLGGQRYCGDDGAVRSCGPDLVTTELIEVCEGKCVPAAASAKCAPITCGDGEVQSPEDCDDGNDDDTDDCTSACTDAVCGDGSVWKGHEVCDDGNDVLTDACVDGCQAASCGDGLVWAGRETCEDENEVDSDACTNACQKASCGDGVVQAGKEECDDENASSGDGCSKECTVEPVSIVPFNLGVCALGSNGQIRCFVQDRDDWRYSSVALAEGERVTAISSFDAGIDSHICALFVGGKVRCWNANGSGQLGLGDKVFRPIGEPSRNADLGGAVATAVAVGRGYTCALLADGSVQCWGDNKYKQLGLAIDANNPAVGDASGEMGAALVPVPQLDARKAASVSAGDNNACEIRADKTLYCWGTYARGVYTAAKNLDLGATLTVREVAVATSHACAVLTDNTLKCWGVNNKGQLGQDDLVDRQTKATMGDSLAPIDLGVGRTARSVAVNNSVTCAVLENGSVKCWGYNAAGQLGKGDTIDVGGAAGDMAALKLLDLGVGRKAKQLALAGSTSCALLDDGRIVCWGAVNTPAMDFLGDAPNEMGDRLPIVELQF